MSSTQAAVKLNFDLMPDFVKQELAASAFNAFQRFMTRPDARAILDRERELLRLEGSTLLSTRTRMKGANNETRKNNKRASL